MDSNSENHAFSVELHNKGNLKSFAFSNSVNGKIVIEGFLGKLLNFSFVENAMLEIQFADGTFRIDLCPQDIGKIQQAVGKVGKQ